MRPCRGRWAGPRGAPELPRPSERAEPRSQRRAAGQGPRHGERSAAVGRAESADPGELAAAERQPRAARPRPLHQVSGAMRPPAPRSRQPARPHRPAGGMDGLGFLERNASLRLAMAPGRLPSAGLSAVADGPWGSGVGQGWAPLRAAALPSPSCASDNFATPRRRVREAAGRFCAFLPADPLPWHRDFCSSKGCVSAWLCGV